MLTEYINNSGRSAKKARNVASRLTFYKAKQDLTWPKFIEKVNGFLVSRDLRTISERWLRLAASGKGRVGASITLKLESFLEAQGF